MQTLKKLLPFLCFAALATPAHAIQQLIKSGAAEPIPIFVVDSTGAPVVGVGTAFTVTVRKPGAGAYIAASGTVAEDGNGVYDYTPSAAETTISASKNVLLVHAVVTATATSFGDASAQIVAFDPATDLGAAALATINTTTTSTNGLVTGINTQTAKIATNAMDSPNEVAAQAQATSNGAALVTANAGIATTNTNIAALPASTVAALFGASFITIPGSHTTTGTGEVLTYKQLQSLSDAVLGGDNTSTVPAASGTASVTYYLRGQPKVTANVVAVSAVTYDASKNQVGRVVLIAQPYPSIP